MRTSVFFATLSAFALASGAVAAESASESSVNYLTETNSLGVVTGQPSVVTSQPSAATSQEAAASIPAGLTAPVVTPATGSFTSSVKSSTPSHLLALAPPPLALPGPRPLPAPVTPTHPALAPPPPPPVVAPLSPPLAWVLLLVPLSLLSCKAIDSITAQWQLIGH
ncbi:hypothetical protein N7507_005084 [Penicillium longicatenatum]|nr:hypothetical protein N7507_005084 [Penicillium longicatenatum]